MNSYGSIKLHIACIRGRSGPHLESFQAVCPPSQLISLLGHDPRSTKDLPAPLREAYERYQRKTKSNRAESIQRYISETMASTSQRVGGFPGLSVGLTEVAVFEPLRERAGITISAGVDLADNVGMLHLDIGARHNRMLLDGIGRLTGAMEFVDKGEDIDAWLSFPITIFAPTPERGRIAFSDLGQLFHDYNYLMARISPTQALEMDQASPYSQIVEWLQEQPVIRDNGGMQHSGASLGKKSTALVVRRSLLGFVTIAAEGEKALQGAKNERVRNPRTTQDNIEEVRERIDGFLSRFAEAMGGRFTDANSIHLTRLGWEAIAMIAHEVAVAADLPDEQIQSCADALAEVDWSRTNPDWFNMIGVAEQDANGKPVLDDQGRERVVITGGKGDQGLRRTIAYLRKRVLRKLGKTAKVQATAADVEEAA